MIDKDGKKVKTVMKDFTIDEISAVDRPAQAHARVAIMKRATREDFEKLDGFSVAMTSMTAGHSHLIVLGSGEIVRRAGQTEYTDGHTHPWLMDDGGQIVVGHAEGHNHGLEVISKTGDAEEGVTSASDLSAEGTADTQAAEDIGNPTEDQNMTQPEKKAAADEAAVTKKHQDEVITLTKRAERAEKVAGLNDGHRGYFKSLSTEDQDTFLAKSDDDQVADIQAVADANKVIYKADDGSEFRKDDDPRLVKMAKEMDAEKKKRLLLEAKTKKSDLEKRAAELPNLPNKDGATVSLLKAIDGLPEGEQEAAMGVLKAHNDRMAGAFKTTGTSSAPNPDATGDDELDSLAKEIQKRDGTTFEVAYSKALQTPEGADLYTKSLEAQMQ